MALGVESMGLFCLGTKRNLQENGIMYLILILSCTHSFEATGFICISTISTFTNKL